MGLTTDELMQLKLRVDKAKEKAMESKLRADLIKKDLDRAKKHLYDEYGVLSVEEAKALLESKDKDLVKLISKIEAVLDNA